MSTPRDECEGRAVAAGLVCGGGVTRKTKDLAAADPDSHSGNAAEARSDNIPVVNELAFTRMLEAMTNGR